MIANALVKMLFCCHSCRQTIIQSYYCRNKKETSSYIGISEYLGVDNPSKILFVTDVFEEAVAAQAAGNVQHVVSVSLCRKYKTLASQTVIR